MKAIALLSSGLDSAIATALANKNGIEITSALTFDYGQRAYAKEEAQAKKIAEYFKIPHETLRLSWFDTFNKTGLLSNSSPLPRLEEGELDELDTIQKSAKSVWVPNRNGVFIEVAASLAEARNISHLILGFNREEATTFKDNSVDYLNVINQALSFSTANGVSLLSPTAPFTKTEIVKKGMELNFPFELLWSCYESYEKMCGLCESCQRLKRALKQNGWNHATLFNH